MPAEARQEEAVTDFIMAMGFVAFFVFLVLQGEPRQCRQQLFWPALIHLGLITLIGCGLIACGVVKP